MNPREELRELIAQAKEHLRYYGELGLTHIGETSAPAAPEPKRPEPLAPTIIPLPQFTPEPTITMPTKQENPAVISLFGEPSLFDEDATGRPFVGRAGQLLTKMIEAIDLKREDVYIANVVKSRPPGNRAPEADEVKACIPFLFRQIEAIRPRLIVALGNPAMQALLDTKIGITKMRGQLQDYPRVSAIKVLPTFHPAYLLRSPDKKREAWEDLKKVRAFLRGEL